MIETDFQLPMKPVPAMVRNPKNLVLMSKPKVGKTSLFAALPNCLILDLEDGSDYVDALKLKANTIEQLATIGQKIIDAGKPYKYVAVDTTTALEQMCIGYAEQLYSQSPMGSSWYVAGKGKDKYGNILGLPDGGGYHWLRQAYDRVMTRIHTWAPHIIQSAHIKDVALAKGDNMVNALEMDLTGKIKRTTAAESDAIGYLYRKGNQNILSFKTTDDVACGARPAHLRNEEIVISEMKDGKLITYWDRVFVE